MLAEISSGNRPCYVAASLEVFVKLRHLLIAVAVPVVMYAGFTVPMWADAAPATCCEGNGGCPDNYRCDYSEPCGTLPGQCVPQPLPGGYAGR